LRDEQALLRRAGFLHDIGRAGVPVALWQKQQPLADSEWERMKRHPALTEMLLARSDALGYLGSLAGLHHERLDGSGYRGVAAASQPITARILAAADAYQARLKTDHIGQLCALKQRRLICFAWLTKARWIPM
jgi:HD-GYP domain-containing protein (c-di-GMP phosphodiesterase class II)